MPLQIMYSSQASAPMSVGALQEILADARVGNVLHNVTGALVYVDGVFFQILEGDAGVVRKLMASIAADARHHSVKVFHEAEVDARLFESWRMAYLSPTAGQMAAWAGLPGATTIDALLRDLERDPQRPPQVLLNMLHALAR